MEWWTREGEEGEEREERGESVRRDDVGEEWETEDDEEEERAEKNFCNSGVGLGDWWWWWEWEWWEWEWEGEDLGAASFEKAVKSWPRSDDERVGGFEEDEDENDDLLEISGVFTLWEESAGEWCSGEDWLLLFVSFINSQVKFFP